MIGTAFYVMDFVPGRVFWDRMCRACGSGARRHLRRLNATLARLHRLDPAALGLAISGARQATCAPDQALVGAVSRIGAAETIPEMDRLIAWLPARAPDTGAAALVHGDYRLDNCILAEDQPAIGPCSTGSSRRWATRSPTSPTI